MHPFQDGNGRTARAVEALMLKRAQLKDTLFIAMSNYYYDEKDRYLASLAEVHARKYDLTPFLKFGLQGIASQCHRLLKEIRIHVEKSLFRDVMGQMYARLESTRKRALAKRELAILGKLLDLDTPIEYLHLYERLAKEYLNLKTPSQAYVRDLNHLSSLGAIAVRQDREKYMVSARPEWATEITETEFFRRMNQLPEAKTKLIVLG
jgi:Fic family protein